jgi:hypothetical protein
MAVDIGFYALAKCDVERGTQTVYIETPLPISKQELMAVAIERDKREIEDDPQTDIRWFVVRLSDAEIAKLSK